MAVLPVPEKEGKTSKQTKSGNKLILFISTHYYIASIVGCAIKYGAKPYGM
ncbi:MAG: hypothetical protein JST13_02115 [Bacteroidetes bacterium]|nr:hypothetical protein [Bacteroidota bacterium]